MANHGEGEIPRMAVLHGQFDPQHGEGFEQPRGAQRTSVDGMKAEVGDQLHYRGLVGRVVAGHKHHGLGVIGRRPRPILSACLVQRIERNSAIPNPAVVTPLRAASSMTLASHFTHSRWRYLHHRDITASPLSSNR